MSTPTSKGAALITGALAGIGAADTGSVYPSAAGVMPNASGGGARL